MPITLTLKEKPVEYRKMILTAIDFGGEDLPNVGALSAESLEVGEGGAFVDGDVAVTGYVSAGSLEVGEGGAVVDGDIEVTGKMTLGSIEVFLLAGAPDSEDLAPANSLCIDTTSADLYINAGTGASPVWYKYSRSGV